MPPVAIDRQDFERDRVAAQIGKRLVVGRPGIFELGLRRDQVLPAVAGGLVPAGKQLDAIIHRRRRGNCRRRIDIVARHHHPAQVGCPRRGDRLVCRRRGRRAADSMDVDAAERAARGFGRMRRIARRGPAAAIGQRGAGAIVGRNDQPLRRRLLDIERACGDGAGLAVLFAPRCDLRHRDGCERAAGRHAGQKAQGRVAAGMRQRHIERIVAKIVATSDDKETRTGKIRRPGEKLPLEIGVGCRSGARRRRIIAP